MFDDLNKQMIVFLLSIKKICRCGMITNEIICFQKFYNDFEVQKPVDKHRNYSISIVKLSFFMCFNNLLQEPNVLVGILLKNEVFLK